MPQRPSPSRAEREAKREAVASEQFTPAAKPASAAKRGKAAAQAKGSKPTTKGAYLKSKPGAHAKGHSKARPGATNHSNRPPAKSKRR